MPRAAPSRLPIDETSKRALQDRLIQKDDEQALPRAGFPVRSSQEVSKRGQIATSQPTVTDTRAVHLQMDDDVQEVTSTDATASKRSRKPQHPQKYEGNDNKRRRTGPTEPGESSGSERSASASGFGAGGVGAGPSAFSSPSAHLASGEPLPTLQGKIVPPGQGRPSVPPSGAGATTAAAGNGGIRASAGGPGSAGKEAVQPTGGSSPLPLPSPNRAAGDPTKSSKKAAGIVQSNTLDPYLKQAAAGIAAAGQQAVQSPPPLLPMTGPSSQPDVALPMPPPPPQTQRVVPVRAQAEETAGAAITRVPQMPAPPAATAAPQPASSGTLSASSTAPSSAAAAAPVVAVATGAGGGRAAAPTFAPPPPPAPPATAALEQKVKALDLKVRELEAQLAQERAKVSASESKTAELEKAKAEGERERWEAARTLTAELIELAKLRVAEKRRELADVHARIGRWEPVRRFGGGGWNVEMQFFHGTDYVAAQRSKVELEARIEDLTKQITKLRMQKTKVFGKQPKAAAARGRGRGGAAAGGGRAAPPAQSEDGGEEGGNEEDAGIEDADADAAVADPSVVYAVLAIAEEEERLSVSQKAAKAELEIVKAKLEEYAVRCTATGPIQMETIRQRAEDDSNRLFSILTNSNYLLTSLLGKGGTGEVWKATDLGTGRTCAVKMNTLQESWSDARKSHYVSHVQRELKIMGAMSHPNIVGFFDTVHVSAKCLAIVMEYCEGQPLDLDKRLKASPGNALPEKEARAILLQVLAALRYMNRVGVDSAGAGAGGGAGAGAGAVGGPRAVPASSLQVIHYDLKPANILFDEKGQVKVADFGLSKILSESSTEAGHDLTSMEQTSVGAGTAWYLPPECFVQGGRISNKVDVYSVGVIFYQMLYGKRPFGDGTQQEQYQMQSAQLKGTWHALTFPEDKKVSAPAKDFLKRALEPNVELRPDVASLCCHPYLRLKLTK